MNKLVDNWCLYFGSFSNNRNVTWIISSMKSIDHLNKEEQSHFIRCSCGNYYDMRDLSQVFNHIHGADIPAAGWTYSIKKGESLCYTATGRKIDLN